MGTPSYSRHAGTDGQGRSATFVETDNKPLEAIMKKGILVAPKRVQSMLLRLQRFDLNVVYRKGAHMFVADTLSRAYLPTSSNDRSCAEIQVEHISMVVYVVASESTITELCTALHSDDNMSVLRAVVLNRWTECRADVPPPPTSLETIYRYPIFSNAIGWLFHADFAKESRHFVIESIFVARVIYAVP